MSYVTLDINGDVSGVYACPQPQMPNYAEIDDADQRLIVFSTKMAQLVLAANAQAELTKTDISVIRCVSAGAAVPEALQTYRLALRDIATGKDKASTELPTKPNDYPAGS